MVACVRWCVVLQAPCGKSVCLRWTDCACGRQARCSSGRPRSLPLRLTACWSPQDLWSLVWLLVWCRRDLARLGGRVPTRRSFHGASVGGTDEPTQFQPLTPPDGGNCGIDLVETVDSSDVQGCTHRLHADQERP